MKTPTLFLDSNIWLRYFLKDNDEFPTVVKLIQTITTHKVRAYTSAIVLLEIAYVLTKRYKKPVTQVYKLLNVITSLPHLGVVEYTDYQNALIQYHKAKIKLGDCFIATQLPKDALLITYDKDFQKISGITAKTPSQILSILT